LFLARAQKKIIFFGPKRMNCVAYNHEHFQYLLILDLMKNFISTSKKEIDSLKKNIMCCAFFSFFD